MNKNRIFSCLFLGIAISSIVLAAERPEENWGETAGGCRVSIRCESSDLKAGDACNIRIDINNVSSDDVSKFRASLLFDYSIHVVLPNGEEAPLTLEGRRLKKEAETGLGPVKGLTMKPGETFTDHVPLNALFDMSQKGEYAVTVSCVVSPKGGKDATVVSNTLKLSLSSAFTTPVATSRPSR